MTTPKTANQINASQLGTVEVAAKQFQMRQFYDGPPTPESFMKSNPLPTTQECIEIVNAYNVAFGMKNSGYATPIYFIELERAATLAAIQLRDTLTVPAIKEAK